MSTLKTNTIQAATGSTVNVASGHKITGAAGSIVAPGHVMQVQYLQYTGTTSVSLSNTSIAIDVLAVNITPTSTNSIIRLDTHIFHEQSIAAGAADTVWFFYRDTTKLAIAEAGGRQCGISMATLSYYVSDAASTPDIANYSYFDAPNTTSQITYKVGVLTYNNTTIYINRSVTDTANNGYERGLSYISATEIAQ